MPDGNKKVFISWSKQTSKRVAKVLKEYLPEVLDGVDLFMSDKDIGPGERSMRVLESQLDDTTYGLLVVTAENQGESWLNFEAGALSKQVGKDEDEVPRVVPLLVDIDSPNLLTGPLSQFQAMELNAEGLLQTIRSIAAFVGSDAAIIEKRFRRAWPDMNKALTEAKRSRIPTKKPERSVESKIDEVLQILRTMQRRVDVRSPRLGDIEATDDLHLANMLANYHKFFVLNISPDGGTAQVAIPKDTTDSDIWDFERKAEELIGNHLKFTYFRESAPDYSVKQNDDPHNGEDQAGDDHAT